MSSKVVTATALGESSKCFHKGVLMYVLVPEDFRFQLVWAYALAYFGACGKLNLLISILYRSGVIKNSGILVYCLLLQVISGNLSWWMITGLERLSLN